MSKQSDAKERQGYNERPIPSICGSCAHYHSVTVKMKGAFGGDYQQETNRRCEIGGFSVKKTATCNIFSAKKEE